ncbi:MAG: DUF1109 domain-containing protein [Nitrosomonadales bacterium]|nr:DUF1109 domain-containing protein [Nitrosomonadales bacterium]
MSKDLEQLVTELAGDAEKIAPAPHPYLLGLKWITAAFAYLAVSLSLSGLRPDLAQALQQPWFAAELALLLLVFIATSISAALLAFPDLHQKRWLAFAPGALFALFVLLLLSAWRADVPPAPLPVHSIECTQDITLLSLLPAAWVFFLLRGYASTHPHWAGSIALLAAFSVGAIWLRLYEINDSIIHVIQWHYLPMLGVAFFGWIAGKYVLKW